MVTDSRSCLPSDVQRNAASMRIVRGNYTGTTGGSGGFGGSGGSGGSGGFGGSGGSGGSGGFGGSGGSSSSDAVYFYTECGYRGSYSKYAPGDVARVTGSLFRNISSVKIPSGWSVTLYTAPDYQGTRYTLTSSSSCLPASLNDKVASFKIIKR